VVKGVGHLNLFEAPHRFVDFLSEVRQMVATPAPATDPLVHKP
jgi:hypothetical protein